MPIISKTNLYIFFTTILFFLALWILNPGNYIVAAAFIVLIFIYNFKLKNFRISLLLAIIASSVVFTGKTYSIEIIPKGILPLEIYPFGYFINYTITPNAILSVLLAIFLIRDIVNSKVKGYKFIAYDYILIAYFLWSIISDYFGSQTPGLSLLFSTSSLTALFLYFSIKLYVKQKNNFFELLVYLFSAIIIFESLISIQQFISKAPLGKTLESQQGIEYFGRAVDEIQFTFRSLGTFIHANAFGIWISSCLIIITLHFLTKPNYLFAAAFLTGTTSLVLTLSRSSWIGYLTGVLTSLFVLEKLRKIDVSKAIRKYLIWFIVLGVPLLAFFVFPRFEKSLYTFSQGGGYFREVQLERAFELVGKNPIFGVGSTRSVPEGLKITSPSDPNFSILADVHNWYILSIVEHGVPSIVLFLIILYLYFRKLFIKKVFSIKSLSFAAGVGATLIAGLFQPYINFQIIIIALAFL